MFSEELWISDDQYDEIQAFSKQLPDFNESDYWKPANVWSVPVNDEDMALNKPLEAAEYDDLFNPSPSCSGQNSPEIQPYFIANGSPASHPTNNAPETISDILAIQAKNINREASHAVLNQAFIDERQSFLFETAEHGLFLDNTSTNMSTSILVACQGGFSCVGNLVEWMMNKSDFDASTTSITRLPKTSISSTFAVDIVKITFSSSMLWKKHSYNKFYLKRIDPDLKLKQYSFERYRAGSPTFYSPVLSARKLYDGTLKETVPMIHFELPNTSKTETTPKEAPPIYECIPGDCCTKIKLRKIKPNPLLEHRKLSTFEYINNLNEKIRTKKQSKNLTSRERIWKKIRNKI